MKRSVKNSGFEEKKDIVLIDNKESFNKNEGGSKFMNNVIRARSKIFEYALCNDFDYFVTLTLDSKKYNREDLKKYIKDFGQMIRDYRKKYKSDVKYLLIPELHKDGVSWHMHGLISGILEEQLTLNKNGYLDWKIYSNKFGYISIDKIRNKDATSKYITKYISKSFLSQKSVSEKYQKLYYNTRNLKCAEKIKIGTLSAKENIPLNVDFENEYCKIYNLNKLDFDLINSILPD